MMPQGSLTEAQDFWVCPQCNTNVMLILQNNRLKNSGGDFRPVAIISCVTFHFCVKNQLDTCGMRQRSFDPDALFAHQRGDVIDRLRRRGADGAH